MVKILTTIFSETLPQPLHLSKQYLETVSSALFFEKKFGRALLLIYLSFLNTTPIFSW